MTYWLPIEKKVVTVFFSICVLILAGFSFGCQSAPKVPMVLNDDLPTLVQDNAQFTLYQPLCHMVGNSKIGICEFKAMPEEINLIANSFDMTEIQPGSKTLQFIKYDEKNSTLGTLFVQGKEDIKAYGIFGRPAKLICKNGNAFEYLILFYKPLTKEASLETCYCSSSN